MSALAEACSRLPVYSKQQPSKSVILCLAVVVLELPTCSQIATHLRGRKPCCLAASLIFLLQQQGRWLLRTCFLSHHLSRHLDVFWQASAAQSSSVLATDMQ